MLSLVADLRSEFTWNTKQLYVHVDVDFSTPQTSVNRMVMWNTIIQLKENAAFRVDKLRPMYPFAITDRDHALRGRPFNVTVAWNVMPKVGRSYSRSKTFTGFQLPEEYSTAGQNDA